MIFSNTLKTIPYRLHFCDTVQLYMYVCSYVRMYVRTYVRTYVCNLIYYNLPYNLNMDGSHKYNAIVNLSACLHYGFLATSKPQKIN